MCLCLAAPIVRAASFREDFSADPAGRDWAVLGQADLFRWDATNQDLAVTWDSSRANSYFHRSLGTVLTRQDDFSLAFDLRLDDVAVGEDPLKPATFEIAVGLVNFAEAAAAGLQRGTGIDPAHGPRDLVEFDYFPDSGFGATISPTLVSSNNQFAVGFNFPLELVPGDLFRVEMTYTASNLTLATLMTRNGQAFGPIRDVRIGAAFTDFRLDTLAVASYSDAGADGSLRANGRVDNLEVTAPDPPIGGVTGGWQDGAWEVRFTGSAGWLYALERATDLQSWTNVSSLTAAGDGPAALSDTNAPAGSAFYRVRAGRP